MTIIKKAQLLAAGLLLAICYSCIGDDLEGQSVQSLKEGEIALQWIPAQMGVYKADGNSMTRGTDPKDSEEQKINNLHVFLFNKTTKDYLQAKEDDMGSSVFQGYKYLEGDNNWVLQSQFFYEDEAKNAIIYVIANVPRTYFGEIIDGKPENVPNMEALEAMEYKPETFFTSLPKEGLPMVVKQEGDLSVNATDKLIAVKLRSMMARIDLNFSMLPDDPCDDDIHPSFKPIQMIAHNFPVAGKFVPQIEDASQNKQATKGETIEAYECTDFSLLNQEVNMKTGTMSGTFYMFERSVPAKEATEIEANYPKGIPDSDKQRYKPKNFKTGEKPAYIEMKGEYTNHNLHKIRATYLLYLGGNPVDNFTIGTNRQYKNNIIIKGITAHDNVAGDEALLDTRVTIDRDENPYFIEMLRERKHDAHFNVTPMDVYMQHTGSKIVISIKEENGRIPDWIRMEPKCKSPTGGGTKKAENKGEGKRNYFTYDLMDELRQKDNDYSTKYEVTESGERIYFYLDENLSENEREATILLQYYDKANGEMTSERDISIRQKGLFKIHIAKFDDGKDIYLEYYEEYLNHFDPKEAYTDSVPGYKWGPKEDVGIPYEQSEWMQDGKRCTEKIIETLGTPKMTLNGIPGSAAEYCYNKNKRDKDGNVRDVQWYLPAIAEIEYFLEEEFNTFKDFQDNFYWSSSPAWQKKQDRENQHARSTKILYKPGTPVNGDGIGDEDQDGYAHIESEQGQGGFQERSTPLRIRCARASLKEQER